MGKNLTTTEVAERLGRSKVRIVQLIREGRIPAEKFGRDYLIKEENLENFKLIKPSGRPLKNKEN